MLTTAIATTVALLAGSALADNCGYAIVENKCDYDVHIFNTPAMGGGQDQHNQVLAPNAVYQQQWTQLTNGQGWSIKLSPSTEMSNIMQYEYTYHNDGIIWYDLSDVNGNPWNGNWSVAASNSDSCHPKQQAYCFSTDDAYGMQACPAEAHITVTLCSADQNNVKCNSDSADSTSYVSAAPTSYSSSAPAPSSYAAPSTTEAASSSAFATPSQSAPAWMSPNTFYAVPSTSTSEAPPPPAPTSSSEEAPAATPTSTYVAPTTFATSSTAVIGEYGVTVTDIDTAIVTDVVTMTAYNKRHEHHVRHPHHRHV